MTRRELEEMESRIRNRHPDTLDWRYYMLGLIEEIELLQDRVSARSPMEAVKARRLALSGGPEETNLTVVILADQLKTLRERVSVLEMAAAKRENSP